MVVTCFSICGVIAAKESSSKGKIVIGFVDNANYKYLDGAGCYFSTQGLKIDFNDQKSLKYTFLSTIDKPIKGWINVDGKLIEVLLILDNNGNPKAGEPYKQIFISGDLSVNVEGVVKKVGYEHWIVEGEIIVSKGKQKTRVKVVGNCGS